MTEWEQYKLDSWCMDKIVHMEPWARDNLQRLLDAVGPAVQTKEEAETLIWLAGWEDATIGNLCKIFERLRQGM